MTVTKRLYLTYEKRDGGRSHRQLELNLGVSREVDRWER